MGWLEQGSKATVHLGPIGSVHSSPLIELPRIFISSLLDSAFDQIRAGA